MTKGKKKWRNICLSPPSRPFCIISLLPFFLPINYLMYRYASRVASIRLDLAIFDSRRRILYNIHRVAYRYIRKLIAIKKGSREIMRNGREGGERQIYVNRQRRMKCQKFWWKSGSHENRDISGILQYFAKPFLDLHRRRNGLNFLLISFFYKAEYTAKSDGNWGDTSGFLDISRFSIVNISWTKWDKNPDFIPLESPCDSEQNRPSPDF